MIGSSLHHYRIVDALGSGGMGAVYVADDTRLHRRVALKVLPPEMLADSTRLQRFRREAQAVAALNHPNVVTIYSVEECEGVHFLTMELVEGRTLETMIPKGGFALRELLDLAIPLAEAVAAAHQRGIIHRDLKPANVMVTNDGRLKVLDFGVAKLDSPATGSTAASASTDFRTAEHRIIGTVHYMSPEQAEGRPVDQRTDIFSLGVMLYEMATGERPFRGNSQVAIVSAILKDTPAPLSGELGRVIARCLNKDLSRRYQSALDLRNDLEEIKQPVGPRRWLLWIAAAVAAIVILAGAIALYRSRPVSIAPLQHATFQQLTANPGIEWFPSLSPDAKWFVYAGDGAGNRDIYLQSVSGQTAINLTKDSPVDDDQPAFSPDGEQIVFRSEREGGGLYIMGRTGEAVRRVTSAGFNPAWSPDGTQIAYASEPMEINPQNSQSVSAVWITPASGGTPRMLAQGDAIQPVWSPHAHRIAFTRRLRGRAGRSDIWTIPVNGGTATPLVTGAAVDWNPAWAPDGKHIYFSSDRDGSMNLWRIAVDEEKGIALGDSEPMTTPAPFAAHPSVSRDGSQLAFSSVLVSANIQRLTFDPKTRQVKGEPQWITTGSRSWSSPDPSPDGQWIAFYSRIRPEGDLYVVRADGTGLRQLTTDPAVDRVPRWSPDGKWISMFSDRGGGLEVWKVRLDGSDLQPVTASGNFGLHTWSPDGARMAVTAVGSSLYLVDPNRPAREQKPVKMPDFTGPKTFMVNSWSPDGKTIAGLIGESGNGIATFSPQTRTYTTLTDFGEWPAWYPDSRHILFVARGKEFWEVDAPTRQARKLYSTTRDVIGPPRLTRDGTAAYYSRRVTESDIWMMTLR